MTQWGRFIHPNLLSVIAAAMLATSMVACSDAPATTTTQAAPRTALSGEEVFRGVAFGEGFVAEQLPELWENMQLPELTPEEQEARAFLKDQLVADLREADPTFIDRFGDDIQSGDHLRIERMMDESGALVKQVTEKRAPAASKKDHGSEKGACVVVVALGNVAVVVNLAAIANVAWNINWVWSQAEGTGGTSLERDQVVDMLATRLDAE